MMETRKRAGCGASFHTDQHDQSCVHMERSGSGQVGYQLMKGSVQLRERVLRLDHPLTSSSRVVSNRWECENLKSISLDVYREFNVNGSSRQLTLSSFMHRIIGILLAE